MAKAKKQGAEQLIHMSRGLEILLVLGPDEERVESLKKHGFVVVGYYRLAKTGGNLAAVLPKTGTFACAYSPLAVSPWG